MFRVKTPEGDCMSLGQQPPCSGFGQNRVEELCGPPVLRVKRNVIGERISLAREKELQVVDLCAWKATRLRWWPWVGQG